MPFEAIKKLLNQKIGLNPHSIGESSIDRAIRHRIAAIQAGSVEHYLNTLLNDNAELHELIEEVVVPETWFFRNKTPFEALQDYFRKQILPGLAEEEKIRILSLPCSSGEEPYSVLIALQEAGINLDRVDVDAVDVSKRALLKARRAVYGRHSFRGVPPEIIEKYFESGESGYKLHDSVKNRVNFRQGNFLIGSLSPQFEYYHAIFCRNLLIYFDRELQKVALEKLHRSLKNQGVLFVGHVETSQVSRDMFTRLPYPHSFGFLKVSGSALLRAQAQSELSANVAEQWRGVFEKIAKIPKRAQVKPKHDPQAVKNKVSFGKEKYSRENKISAVASLETIEKYANEGQYEEARMRCEEYLKIYPSSARAYYLLALINDSSGGAANAEELLKKAIYLDPNNEAALIMSGLLAEKKGDLDAAKSYKRRAERASKRKGDQVHAR